MSNGLAVHLSTDAPSCRVVSPERARPWIVLQVGEVSFHFPEWDDQCVAHARAWATALTAAADELERIVAGRAASEPVRHEVV
jgi:hypothetical protein